MGDVDLLDGLLGRHKIKMRSRKWYMRVFHHLLDVTIVNSWFLHKKIQIQKKDSNVMTLVNFREQLALSLCKIGNSITPKRGRPSNEIQEGIIKKGKMGITKGQHAPLKEVRTDKIDHWPVDLCIWKFANSSGKIAWILVIAYKLTLHQDIVDLPITQSIN